MKRGAEVTKPISFDPLPEPDKTGKVKCDEVIKWCVKQVDNIGDINERMKRVVDGE